MKKIIPKKTIISLIKDDLKHLKLTLGLNMLGFKNENSELDISKTIFQMMQLNIHDDRLEHLKETYFERIYQVTEIAHNDSESFHRLSIEIYNWLQKEQKRYKKKKYEIT
ncbi:MAG: hypothetical protein ACO1N0_01780 [Fluviicola sp.]